MGQASDRFPFSRHLEASILALALAIAPAEECTFCSLEWGKSSLVCPLFVFLPASRPVQIGELATMRMNARARTIKSNRLDPIASHDLSPVVGRALARCLANQTLWLTHWTGSHERSRMLWEARAAACGQRATVTGDATQLTAI